MTDYELYSYEAFRRHLHDDERIVDRADIRSLDPDLLRTFTDERKRERPGLASLAQDQMYEMLNILRNGKPTLAAVMNMGIYPQGYFPNLCITAVSVPGTQIGDVSEDHIRFLDNRRIEGTISSMMKEALDFCRRNMKIRTVVSPETGLRTDRTEYPMDAVREAVLNALIHRDYSTYTEGTPVQIDFFSDRLEIHSPGSLYGRMTVDQLGTARPDLRNPALAVMTEILTSAENRYSGIPTMRRAMSEYGLPAPVFENRRNEFVVTFYNSGQDESKETEIEEAGRQNRRETLVYFCRTPRTRREIAEYLGIKTTAYAMSEYVQPLLESGQLKMTMPDKPRSSLQRYYSEQR